MGTDDLKLAKQLKDLAQGPGLGARFIFQTLLSWFGEAKRFIKQTQNGCLRALARRRCLHAIFAS